MMLSFVLVAPSASAQEKDKLPKWRIDPYTKNDPEAMANVQAIYGDRVTFSDRPYGALEGADGLAIVTEWPEFRTPDFDVMKKLLAGAVLFDGRNIYDEKAMAGYGFTYYAIGRGKR